MPLHLTIDSGPMAGKSRTVETGVRIVVGRDEQADWVLREDSLISHRHFAIEWDGATPRVIDLGTRFGTTVNGDAAKATPINEGDRITAGNSVFRVRLTADVLSATSAPKEAWPTATVRKATGDAAERAKRVLQELRKQSEPLFAILDAAREPPAVLAKVRECKEQCQSLYEGPEGELIAHDGPFLVSLPKESAFLQSLVEDGWGRSWGVFLTSHQSFAEVRKHLRRFLMVQHPDGDRVFFRYYDPRVLRAYLPTLTEAEWQMFADKLDAFLLEGDSPDQLLQFSARRSPPRPTVVAV